METLREATIEGSDGSISPITDAQKPKDFYLRDDDGGIIYSDTEPTTEETHSKKQSKCNHGKTVANKIGANDFRGEDIESDESDEDEGMPTGNNTDNTERKKIMGTS